MSVSQSVNQAVCLLVSPVKHGSWTWVSSFYLLAVNVNTISHTRNTSQMSLRIGLSYRLAFLATAVAIAPSKPFASLPPAPSRPYALGRSMSRTSILKQALGLLLLPSTASAAEKKPNVKDVVAQLEASTPKEERNAAGDKADHFPKIAFEGSQGQGKKIVFTVPHENLSPPGFSYIEYMWIKDESSGDILTAKKFTQSDPNLVITAYGNSGQKLTAASKDNKFGIWEGTFLVP
jgi:desulfoferrodoxin (superoxide reductase-like protein)